MVRFIVHSLGIMSNVLSSSKMVKAKHYLFWPILYIRLSYLLKFLHFESMMLTMAELAARISRLTVFNYSPLYMLQARLCFDLRLFPRSGRRAFGKPRNKLSVPRVLTATARRRRALLIQVTYQRRNHRSQQRLGLPAVAFPSRCSLRHRWQTTNQSRR
jgi:hypothetical protein